MTKSDWFLKPFSYAVLYFPLIYLILTLRTLALVLLSKIVFVFSTFSGITKPILSMLVLIWMRLSWRFQVWSWNSTILTFFTTFLKILTCRLHSSAPQKALKSTTNFTLHGPQVLCVHNLFEQSNCGSRAELLTVNIVCRSISR